MGSIPNGSAPLQACARQIFKSMLPGRTGKAQVYKLNKEKKNQQYATLEEIYKTIKDNNIQFGNLIFYNFDIPAIKKKLKERNL